VDSIKKTDDYIFQTYPRCGNVFVKGDRMTLWDDQGNTYLDFLSGIAVCGLGHCHPKITQVIASQAATLVHVCNLFYTQPQAELAEILIRKSFAKRVFFSNSGAEANEGAIKLARRYFQSKGQMERYKIITMEKSFHGRTMATLSATGQDKIKEGFYPMLDGFVHVPFNDIDALKSAVDESVCAVMLEPIQGEGGVVPADEGYLKQVRDLCDQKGVLLIFDEIQTGMGRCGTLFAHELYDVKPDIMTLAKALGNGFPIGAMLANEEAEQGFVMGSHGTTFGGTPLATAIAFEVVKIISDVAFLENVRSKGSYFRTRLEALKEKHDRIKAVRGKGLLLGMEIDEKAEEIVAAAMKKGFIINGIQDKILRFVPPLIVDEKDIDQLINMLDELFK
jgi:acetylornithine/N-succinyldiaminopimelate aminotransferase